MDRSKYPADWDAISAAVRERAGNVCEWCGVPNGAVGWRDQAGYFHAAPDRQPGDTVVEHCIEVRRGIPQRVARLRKVSRIVLTVAHLGAPLPGDPPWRGNPHDKQDVRPENLAALCQRDHLGYDLPDHMLHAAATRRRKRIAAGQVEAAL